MGDQSKAGKGHILESFARSSTHEGLPLKVAGVASSSCTLICVLRHIPTYTHAFTSTSTYTYMHIHIHIHLHLHVHVHMHIHMHIHIHIRIHTCIDVFTYTPMNICMYLYMMQESRLFLKGNAACSEKFALMEISSG